MSGSVATLFQRLTQGVYVVGVAHGETRNAFTAAWLMQVSYDPLLLALSINPNHSSYLLLKEGRSFSVNVLKKGQLDLADHYGRSAQADRLTSTDWTTDRNGPPLLREALAWFECQAVSEYPAGDHVRRGPLADSANDCYACWTNADGGVRQPEAARGTRRTQISRRPRRLAVREFRFLIAGVRLAISIEEHQGHHRVPIRLASS